MRRRNPPEAPQLDRPAWLCDFRWHDWDDPDVPLPDAAKGFNAGSRVDPAEERWIRRVLAARSRWNAARAAWFWDHGEGENHYRARLTGKTPQDIKNEEIDE